ncbi:protein of unknown function [Bradyrhizobium sp. ORS 285]|nr:hypothetical protein BRAO285_510004 [Bradyrhizobium sp. ORS 285]SMX58363.1 protein of unknown function [Bradyrhizobium sp. ORS 285]
MTKRHESSLSRCIRTRALTVIPPSPMRGRREGRVQAAPMARLQKTKQAAVTTGLAEQPAFPARRF